MKIAIIGSTQYQERMFEYERELLLAGHEVRLPVFDHSDFDELQVCEANRDMIEWADRVDIVWNRRSLGTVFDFGMAFALRKPIHVVYLEPKTFANVMKWYEEKFKR